MIHEIECLTQNFEDIVSGVKTFEILENDRNYRVGDYLAINELAISNNLLCDKEGDRDDEDVFDQGRGQGMYEVCANIKAIIEDLEVYFAD